MQEFRPGTPAIHWARAPGAAAIWLILIALSATMTHGAADNGGLGPLSVRNQFPPSLGFLNFTPEAPRTIDSGDSRISYQYAVANTFINTQAPSNNASTVIDKSNFPGKLDETDFASTGYGAYIDVETRRHQFAFRYGLTNWFEVGLEMAWISFDGGGLDSRIESFESSIGALNKDRTDSPRDRFDFYLIRDGTFLFDTNESAELLPQDPVFQFKWKMADGGDFLPMITLKGTYKTPLQTNPASPRNLVSSGGIDYGYYLFLAKRIGSVIGHFQFGITQLEVSGDNFNSVLSHKMIALEFRTDASNSWLLQVVTQSSLFRSADFSSNPEQFLISRPTDVLVLGHKFQGRSFSFDFGMVEDFNQNQNETDIIIFIETGWQW